MIVVCGLNAVQDQVDTHGVGRVISLLSPDTPHRSFDGIVPEQHLRLSFHDIVEAAGDFSAPKATDAEKLVRFIEAWDRKQPLLIHCWAGISRSTASAYTALCMLRPKVDEEELAFELRAASPSATPNKLIVSYTDALLGRSGRMSRAIEKIGRGENAFEGMPFILRP
jgi:predicted protein tyrosine phosphatase